MILLSGLMVIGILITFWLTLGRGPRRRRAYRRVHICLQEGDWTEALAQIAVLEKEGGLPEAWKGRFRNARGEAHGLAVDAALKERRYREALDHALAAAPLLGSSEQEARVRVTEAMLAEIRRLFSGGSAHTDQVLSLAQQTHDFLGKPCPEAMFWTALCQVRRGDLDQALRGLATAHERSQREALDPALYMGILLHQQGKAQESLRYLAEANRIASTCPFVAWQMGISLVASSAGDAASTPLAIRALQRALGPRGLGLWLKDQKTRPAGEQRVWVEAFPEARSYVRRLAARYPFSCPVLGQDLGAIVRRGEQALAQAYYWQGQYQEAADLFTKLLQESPPTVPLLRGLGLALARLDRYDQAYKYLRAALEEEQPKDPFTAGYLALCGSLGRPLKEEDKPRNVSWALRLLARYPLAENQEWASLLSRVHAEARSLELPLSREDQILLCDTLASVRACDPQAAQGYAHLCQSFPDAIQPMYAWLYARACVAENVSTDQDLPLLGHVFTTYRPAAEANSDCGSFDCGLRIADCGLPEGDTPREAGHAPDQSTPLQSAIRNPQSAIEKIRIPQSAIDWEGPAAAFFREQGWDFAEAEYVYLERCAQKAPGQFPAPLGPEYPGRGQAFLLTRSHAAEQAGQMEEARRPLETLVRLAPQSVVAHDRLAALRYRQGEGEQALELLESCTALEPESPWPLVRQAILAEQLGRPTWPELITRALQLTTGERRARIAYLGARLALRQAFPARGGREPTEPSANGEVIQSPESRVQSPDPERNTPPALGSGLWTLDSGALDQARGFLETCLEADPHHLAALKMLAAVLSVQGKQEGLGTLADRLDRADVRDPSFHFLGAVCQMARGDDARVVELVQRALRYWQEGGTEVRRTMSGVPLDGECHYLQALARVRLGDHDSARQALQQIANLARSPSLAHARALLGRLHFLQGDHEEAARWWVATDPPRRAEWRLDGLLRQTVVLAGLQALETGRCEQAADRFQEAGRLGLRDPRLSSWIVLALVRAGQRLLYSESQEARGESPEPGTQRSGVSGPSGSELSPLDS